MTHQIPVKEVGLWAPVTLEAAIADVGAVEDALPRGHEALCLGSPPRLVLLPLALLRSLLPLRLGDHPLQLLNHGLAKDASRGLVYEAVHIVCNHGVFLGSPLFRKEVVVDNQTNRQQKRHDEDGMEQAEDPPAVLGVSLVYWCRRPWRSRSLLLMPLPPSPAWSSGGRRPC